jgi:hypothetical protein
MIEVTMQRRICEYLKLLPCLMALGATACAHVPGETLTSGGLQRDIKARVLSLADVAKPECKRNSIVNTEVLELFPGGKVSLERWSVDRCGQRKAYQVHLPASAHGSTFTVSPER